MVSDYLLVYPSVRYMYIDYQADLRCETHNSGSPTNSFCGLDDENLFRFMVITFMIDAHYITITTIITFK